MAQDWDYKFREALARLYYSGYFCRDRSYPSVSQEPRFEKEELDEWLNHDQYWSDSPTIRSYLQSIFYHMARSPYAYIEDLAAWRLLSEGFHDWPEDEKGRVRDAALAGWLSLLAHRDPPSVVLGDANDVCEPPFAFRFLEFSSELGVIAEDYFRPLFQGPQDAVTFGHECAFVVRYAANIYSDPEHPWFALLPDRALVKRHIEVGFFAFPDCEDIASQAFDCIDYETFGYKV